MKHRNSKSSIYFVIIYNAAIFILCITAIISMFFINKPDKLNKNDFIKIVEKNGCLIENKKDKSEGISDYITTSKQNCPYEIKYITYYDEDTLNDSLLYFSENVLDKNSNIKETQRITIDFLNPYYEYTTKGDQFKKLIYNEESILYISSPIKYENNINKILQDSNYKYKDNFDKTTKFLSLAFFLILIVLFVSMWGTLKKTRNKGWITLIPFYNIGALTKDVMGSPWYALLLLLPIGNTVFQYLILYKTAKAFNKTDSYAVLLMFFPTVVWPLLAFDDSEYVKPEKKSKNSNKNSNVKKTTSKKENKNEKVVNKAEKIIAIIFFFIAACFFESIFEEDFMISDIVLGIFFLIYGLLLLPEITNKTNKYSLYTKYKALIVTLIIILNLILIYILPI